MDTVFNILIGATVLVGLSLALYGIYGLITGQIQAMDKKTGRAYKVTGGEARKFGLFYFLAGSIWIIYAMWRFIDS